MHMVYFWREIFQINSKRMFEKSSVLHNWSAPLKISIFSFQGLGWNHFAMPIKYEKDKILIISIYLLLEINFEH